MTAARRRRAAVRRAWADLGRDAAARRLVQMAAACGVAVFSAAGGEGAQAMTWLLESCLAVEDGMRPAPRETWPRHDA